MLAKTSSEKNHKRKPHSSGSSTEEQVPPEFVVPHKGKELPRTPPNRTGICTDLEDKEVDFLKPKPALLSPSIVPPPPPKTYSNQATIGNVSKSNSFFSFTNQILYQAVETKKGFRQILPTREIPRTPMRGVSSSVEDTHFLQATNPNLTVDFSASRLTSSNTSTPYSDNRSSHRTTSIGGETFVVSPKRSEDLMDNSKKPKYSGGESESFEQDSVFEKEELGTGTFVKPQEGKKEAKDNFDSSWKLELQEDNNGNIEDENMAPAEAQRAKKKPGKEPKNPLKEKSAKPDVAAKTNDETAVKNAVETLPENVETNRGNADAVVAAPKSKRGKAAKKDVEEVVDLVESEPEVKKGRAKKGSKKDTKEDAEESPASSPIFEPQTKATRGKKEEVESPAKTESATASPIFEPEVKKGRGKKNSKKETEEEAEETVPVIYIKPFDEIESPVAEVDGKKGKGKKGGKKDESPAQTNSATASPIFEVEVKKGQGKKGGKKEDESPSKTDSATSSPIFEAKAGRGKKGDKKEIPQDTEEATPAEDPVEAKGKKGRPKKAQPVSKVEEDVYEPVIHLVDEKEQEVAAADAEVPAKKGRGRKPKEPVKEVAEQKEAVPEPEAVPAAPEAKKKGRGKKNEVETADPEQEAPPAEVKKVRGKAAKTAEAESAVEEVPQAEVKKGRGRAKAAVVEEVEAPAEEKKGRGKPKSNGENAETEPAKAPVAEVKKGRGRPAKAASVEDISEASQAPEAAPAKKGRGKKAAAKPEEVAESSEEEPEPPKNQKASKRGKAAEDDVTSPPKKMKEDAAEPEGPRKSSRNKGEPVKSYDESEKKQQRGRKKAEPKAVAEEEEEEEEAKVEEKKKPGKKKAAETAEPEVEPPKAVAKRGNNKRGNSDDQKEAEPSAPEEKKTARGGKKTAAAKLPGELY